MANRLITELELEAVANLSSREAAKILGVGKSTINDYRAKKAITVRPTVNSTLAPAWPVIQQAKPVVVQYKPAVTRPATKSEWKTAVVFPDPQIGFRLYEDGTLDPYHDTKAMSVALSVLDYEQQQNGVDQLVNLGDFLDLPSQGKYAQEAAFANTTQLAIDYGHVFLAKQRALAPNAKIILIEGNHDRRLQNFVELNALSAFGLRRAGLPDTWPVMSLPYLLRLDELNVEYIDAYPAGVHWIADDLRAIHGDKVRSGGSTAAAYTNALPHISTVFGHTHRLEIQSKTTFDRMGKIRSMAISPGCLCRTDGAVPSVNGAIGIDGRPAQEFENWQNGIAVIKYKDNGEFFVNLVQIDGGKTVYNGVEFRA
jgi:Calcineurin-like phosphoesterase.